jgi:hypothetical protein
MDPAPVSSNDSAQISLTTFIVHRRMVLWLFFATIAICAVSARFLTGPKPSVLISVILAGSLGGFVSALRRLYTFSNIFPTEAVTRRLGKSYVYVIVYSLIPPLIGAIAAAVLYLVFAAGILQGPFFPKFDLILEKGDEGYSHFKSFIEEWRPAASVDYARAILWGFAAGFSERLVPDLLERLGEKTKS